jgi:cell division protein FtsW
MKTPKPKTSPDYAFIIIVGVLIIFGLVMLASASSDLAKEKFGDSYFYLKHQIIFGLSFGVIGFLIASFLYYHRFQKMALIMLLANIALLILTLTPLGMNAKGASRWLEIGGFSFQPAEFLKFTLMVYIASWISKNKSRIKSFSKGLLPFLIILGSVTFLLVIQPSTTMAVILLVAAGLTYFTSGAKIKFVIGLILIGLLSFALMVYITPYRMQRVTTFLNPNTDALDEAYHINQSLIAIGSGGITGVGYGQSTTKLNYLPEPIGDSIFAVIGEELGFVGSSAVIFLFIAFAWRGLAIAKKTPDIFGRLLVIGFTSVIVVQTIINMGAISEFLPLTGIPLPFVSYGGTALAISMVMVGTIVNISKYRKK